MRADVVQALLYLEQAEHGVADVEAMPPVMVGDGTVTLPHCVHPLGQRLSTRRERKEETK